MRAAEGVEELEGLVEAFSPVWILSGICALGVRLEGLAWHTPALGRKIA